MSRAVLYVGLLFVSAVFFGMTESAKSDVVTEFQFTSGTLPYDSYVTGDMTIDVTTGQVESGEVVLHHFVADIPGGFAPPRDISWEFTDQFQFTSTRTGVFFGGGTTDPNNAELIIQTPSLVGFTGGQTDIMMTFPVNEPSWDTGAQINASAQIAPTVPEASSMAAWFGVIALVVGVRNRRK